MKTCCRCHIEKPIEDFPVHSQKTGRVHFICRPCRREYDREYWKGRKATYNPIRYSRKPVEHAKRKAVVDDHLAHHPCVDCGETDVDVLEFDHVRGVKKNCVAELVQKGHSIDHIQEEIAKCEVRCANCHRRKTRRSYHRGLV